MNWFATHIIAPSEKAKEVIVNWERAPRAKVHVIPHGFDLTYFLSVSDIRIETVRNAHKIGNQSLVIGVIARYTHLKGVQFIIPAFKRFIELHPNAHLILANAQGDYEKEIREMLSALPSQSYTEIKFEPDIAALYKLFTFFVQSPIDVYAESFGQTYVEALASGIPSIVTLSGIASDFIKHEENALVVGYENSEQIFNSLERLINNPDLKEHISSGGLQSVHQFDISIMTDRLYQLYHSE